jgi:RNA polymerase sigma-70 factor (ECF subfamily)
MTGKAAARTRIAGGDATTMPAHTRHTRGILDDDSARWIESLRDGTPGRDEAISRLHALLLRAARFEIARRSSQLAQMRGESLEDLATQSADDALVALLAKLDDYCGDSRFTTWAYKFALLEAAVKLRRRTWQGRELPVEADGLSRLGGEQVSPDHTAETAEFLHELAAAIEGTLTPHQRDVLVSLALNGIPIDVLAEHLNTTRGALYKTLHDARRKLRATLAATDLSPDPRTDR